MTDDQFELIEGALVGLVLLGLVIWLLAGGVGLGGVLVILGLIFGAAWRRGQRPGR